MTGTEAVVAAPILLRLPHDVIDEALLPLCDAADLLVLSSCCVGLRRAVEQPHVWERALRQRHDAVINTLFEGTVPRPAVSDAAAWKRHLLDFEHGWLAMARKQTGRVLLRMSVDCESHDDPTYLGVPPPRISVVVCKGEIPVPFTGVSFPITLSVPWRSEWRDTVGIYDVTSFVPMHPGADRLLLDAALEYDATRLFDAASHSHAARRILRGLVVPGLEGLRAAPPLRPTRTAAARTQWSAIAERANGLLWALGWAYDSLFELCAHVVLAALQRLLAGSAGTAAA